MTFLLFAVSVAVLGTILKWKPSKSWYVSETDASRSVSSTEGVISLLKAISEHQYPSVEDNHTVTLNEPMAKQGSPGVPADAGRSSKLQA